MAGDQGQGQVGAGEGGGGGLPGFEDRGQGSGASTVYGSHGRDWERAGPVTTAGDTPEPGPGTSVPGQALAGRSFVAR